MKKKNPRKFLKLDYTTAVVVGAAMILIFSIGTLVTTNLIRRYQESNDHKKPLAVTNLPYCNNEKLDIFVPQSPRPLPLVIYVHGGGWQYGSKVGGSFALVKPLLESNFAVASINYRLSGSAKFPAQIQDVFCAVRFLRANAEKYNIDGSKIGLLGISAGAHLAALAATASNIPEFTEGPYQEQPSAVRAVVAINGLYNLEVADFKADTLENIDKLLGGTAYSKTTASPSAYLNSTSAAQLIIYGSKDKTVSPKQSLDYLETARRKGAEVTSLNVEGADHALRPNFGFTTKPSRTQLIEQVRQFLVKQLAK